MSDSLIDALPDLAVIIRRDGTVIAHGGGTALGSLMPERDRSGERVEAIWPDGLASLLARSSRKSIAQRAPLDVAFEHNARSLELHVRPLGPDRAVCLIRGATPIPGAGDVDAGYDSPPTQLDRRGFQRRFRESTSLAALAETPLSVAVIQVDGIADIARLIDAHVAEQVASSLVLRLPPVTDGAASAPNWYVGQLGEGLLAVVLDTSDRDAVESCVAQLCASVREPVAVGDAEFHLTPYAGIAVLGQDASSPKALIDNARAAALEAQRDGSRGLHFFSDSLRLRSLSRLDSARELREAIEQRQVRLHYVGRHDLESGASVASVAYLRWLHPVRGEVRPAEFVSVAEATGLAVELSRAALRCIGHDFPALDAGGDGTLRVSFGPLRHHVLHEDFVDDVLAFLASGQVPAERLEVRIAERTFVSVEPSLFSPLVKRGVQIVVDEVARRMASFDRLARAELHGLQLDRAWVVAICEDRVALKVCRAGIAVAEALGITPIATGVDDRTRRDYLLALGCRYGSGDHFLGDSASSDEASPGVISL